MVLSPCDNFAPFAAINHAIFIIFPAGYTGGYIAFWNHFFPIYNVRNPDCPASVRFNRTSGVPCPPKGAGGAPLGF